MARQPKDLHIVSARPRTRVTNQIGYPTEPVTDVRAQGGFGQLFNRTVDSLILAHLGNNALRVLCALIRFADPREGYAVTIGKAALGQYTGLTESGVKDGVRELEEHALAECVQRGGIVGGRKLASVYQLRVPRAGFVDDRPVPRRGQGGARTPPSGVPGHLDQGGARAPVQGGAAAPPARGAPVAPMGVPGRPPFNGLSDPEHNSSDVVAILVGKGVERSAAESLAATHPADRVADVCFAVDIKRPAPANPAGLIVRWLRQNWPVGERVSAARRRAAVGDARRLADRQATRTDARQGRADADAEAEAIDRQVDALDDDDLAALAAAVVAKYEGNPAVLAVLARKPPRKSNLMKMEIAAMLRPAARPS